MPDRPSAPAVPPSPAGKITQISVTYTVNTDDGPRHTFHSLIAMHKHARPEHVRELTDGLRVICEEVLAGRGHSDFGLPQATVRVPFEPLI